MKTRTADPGAPLSQERYMSSREYSELRGLSGVAVAARAAIVLNAEKRKLIWFLQGLSIADGGLRKVAEDMIAIFHDRIESESLGLARHGEDRRDMYGGQRGTLSLEQFLIDLCINPALQIRFKSDDDFITEIERDRFFESYTAPNEHRWTASDFKPASLSYFKDIVGALVQYKARREREAKDGFELTAIARKIWGTLDFALSTRNMVLLDGLEGRGKSEAVKTWCQIHLGEARFVSLKGITSKTTAFREIAKALGIASSYSRTATEMQARIEDVLERSKLMLCLDEAHFMFNQSQRIYSRPELIDWIDTAICNRKIPIALVSTPQFMACMTRAASQVDWNYRQFRRRVRRYVKLPERNTPRDIESVIRRVLPGAPNSAVKQALSFVHLTKRDLSAVGDIVDEIKAMQGRDVLTKVTYEEVTQVIDEHLVPSEKNFVDAIKEATEKAAPRRRTVNPPALAMRADESAGALEDGEETEDATHAAREMQPARFSTDLTTA